MSFTARCRKNPRVCKKPAGTYIFASCAGPGKRLYQESAESLKQEEDSRMIYFLPRAKNKPEQSELCSGLSMGYKKDIFGSFAYEFELLQF